MNILKHFKSFESDDWNEQSYLDVLNRWSVEWQKYKSGERFHIKKKWGKFTFDEFTKIIRDVEKLLNAKIDYEGIELYPMVGARTTWNCKAHTSMARKEKPITISDYNEFYSCEVRLDTPQVEDERCNWTSNYIWIRSQDNGKRIKFHWALPRYQADQIIEKYYKNKDGYTLGDGFRI